VTHVAGVLGLPEIIHTFLKDAKDYEAKNMTTLRYSEVKLSKRRSDTPEILEC
jgi:hypothetical protein